MLQKFHLSCELPVMINEYSETHRRYYHVIEINDIVICILFLFGKNRRILFYANVCLNLDIYPSKKNCFMLCGYCRQHLFTLSFRFWIQLLSQKSWIQFMLFLLVQNKARWITIPSFFHFANPEIFKGCSQQLFLVCLNPPLLE